MKEKISITQVKKDLSLIKDYYMYEKEFGKTNENLTAFFAGKIKLYNRMVKFTPIPLQVLYFNLYVNGLTQESLANKMCYTRETVNNFNKRLINFFHSMMNINDFVI